MAGTRVYLLALVLYVNLISTHLTLAVILPPQIRSSVGQVMVDEGETGVVLECNLEIGDDPIRYRWLKNNQLVTGMLGYAYRRYKQVSLSLHEIEVQHAGEYTCEASNSAGVDTATITVNVASSDRHVVTNGGVPHTDETLTSIATSLSDVLAEGNCECDVMFLLHASNDAPSNTLPAQANLVHIIAETIVSESVRIGLMTYSDDVTLKLAFGRGTNKCSLRQAFRNLTQPLWSTRLEPVVRAVFKRFKKSKSACKVLFLPIFGSLGLEGADVIGAQQLKKLGVQVFVLEVTDSPLPNVREMVSKRGDGQPYHWHVPLKYWTTIVINMKYMSEEIVSCPPREEDLPGVCVGLYQECGSDVECLGAGLGYGCVNGTCRYLECNANPRAPGCCDPASGMGQYWCGDVTGQCSGPNSICDGRIQCMNGADEDRCWDQKCPSDKIARCESSILCLGLMDLCNGEPECPEGEDEDPRFCRSFPCPTDRPFRCRSGKCIATESLCDGVFKDCDEGEDENLDYCNRVHRCPSTRPFKCDYGICITERMVCDRSFNCLDATDELECERKNCPSDRPFKCAGNGGHCIAMDLVCNGIIDGCDDGSDEHNCTNIACPVASFKCFSGICIDSWLVCDGRNDCGDGSDEYDCDEVDDITTTTTSRPTCREGQFLCQSGACISEKKVCNGRRNCLNGDDELDCDARPCHTNRPHRCHDGTCVSASAPCNGFKDCRDGSDEINCTQDKPDDTDGDEDYEEEDYDNPGEDYDYEEEYTVTEDYRNNNNNNDNRDGPVLSVPSAVPTTPPMKPKDDDDDVDDDIVQVPEPKPETTLEDEADHHEDDTDKGDIEDMETILEEPKPEDVQTAASSEQGLSTGICVTSLCVPLVLVNIVALNLANVWMR
ncbi:hypothetical protein Pmani_019024 [Petrolisthes manimaculis]|uniref:Ig-like domain-containing protein n=1 Tax=Petrolisthes manimaculis TaxID=1843537 RepID=A0AAE1PKE3_9EUCA|nr:hypothetical protein Pmani_019024 [Petrolisthes manimaculis]